MKQQRYLVTIADDYGIGPETSRGILDLAKRGLVTGSVFLVNSPHAVQAVKAWKQAGCPMELGWHPCLTLDAPILPPDQVPSLVDAQGKFLSLGRLVKKLFLGRVAAREIDAELRAQRDRFRDLVGREPTIVNAHHHVNVFHPVGTILLDVLRDLQPLPYIRRIREPVRLLLRIPGARKKRWFLSLLGRPLARLQQQHGFPGNDWLLGITDAPWVRDPHFLVRWLSRVPGEVVELTCHPGHRDASLSGRDSMIQRRVDEYQLLSLPSYTGTCRAMGFALVSPGQLARVHTRTSDAA